jgi:hypothetical protein
MTRYEHGSGTVEVDDHGSVWARMPGRDGRDIVSPQSSVRAAKNWITRQERAIARIQARRGQ